MLIFNIILKQRDTNTIIVCLNTYLTLFERTNFNHKGDF